MYPFSEVDKKRLSLRDDTFWMRRALTEAQKAFDAGEVPVGAVIVAADQLVATGSNLVEMLRDATAHAEMIALGAAMQHFDTKYLPECTLYVTVEPCVMCMGALRWSRIRRIVFGAPDVKAGYTVLAPLSPHPSCEIVGGVLADEAATLMRDFFAARRS